MLERPKCQNCGKADQTVESYKSFHDSKLCSTCAKRIPVMPKDYEKFQARLNELVNEGWVMESDTEHHVTIRKPPKFSLLIFLLLSLIGFLLLGIVYAIYVGVAKGKTVCFTKPKKPRNKK